MDLVDLECIENSFVLALLLKIDMRVNKPYCQSSLLSLCILIIKYKLNTYINSKIIPFSFLKFLVSILSTHRIPSLSF